MTGRLASRAADADALLARFNAVSEAAIEALDRRDDDALERALDVRDALQQEIARATRDLGNVRSRFAPVGFQSQAPALVDRAMKEYCAPLEELARVALGLQERLEASAREVRDGLVAQMATLEENAGAAVRYAANDAGDPHRLNIVL
jgi:uncharacterized protein (DUF885 family)